MAEQKLRIKTGWGVKKTDQVSLTVSIYEKRGSTHNIEKRRKNTWGRMNGPAHNQKPQGTITEPSGEEEQLLLLKVK